MLAVVVVVVVGAVAGAPPLLDGIDSLPPRAAITAVSRAALRAVVVDEAASVVHRARAARLLGARAPTGVADDHDDHDDADDQRAFALLRASAITELRVQGALAQGDRAQQRGQLLRFCGALLHDGDVDVRGAAVTLLWRDRSSSARQILLAHVDADAGLRRIIERRLQRWPPTRTVPAAIIPAPVRILVR